MKSALLRDRLGVRAANYLVFISVLLLCVWHVLTRFFPMPSSLWLTGGMEVLLFLVPALLFCLCMKKPLRVQKMDAKRTWTVIGISATAYPVAILASLPYSLFWSYMQMRYPQAAPASAVNLLDYSLPALLVCIAVIPALVEEYTFRGMFMRAYASRPVTALLVSSAVFALMHMQIEKLVPVFLVGFLAGFLVLRTGNLWAGVLVHFFNNAYSMVILKMLQPMIQINTVPADPAAAMQLAMGSLAILVGLLLFSVVCIVGFILLLIRFIRETRPTYQAYVAEARLAPPIKFTVHEAMPLIWTMILVFAMTLVSVLPYIAAMFA
nr:type II CAAX endopeptidase family protein [Maliibacterium massiliense]